MEQVRRGGTHEAGGVLTLSIAHGMQANDTCCVLLLQVHRELDRG